MHLLSGKARAFQLLSCLISVLSGYHTYAQTQGVFTLQGTVTDVDGLALPFVTVYLHNTPYGTTTDEAGTYTLPALPVGSYTLRIQTVGYVTFQEMITGTYGRTLTKDIRLQESTTALDEVVVRAQSEATRLQQSAQSITVVEARPFHNRSVTTTDILNNTPGMRIRQQGGLGSEVNTSVQGISGKQIKVFIDGMPLDAFGQGLSMQVIPPALLDRIEIYKGFIPVTFGSDALGSVVNLVTREQHENYVDASYSVGSFQTHKAHLSSRYTGKKMHVGATAFYNYSANNYPVQAAVTNEYGNPVKQTVKRFHNTYHNHFISLEAGIRHRALADRLTLQLSKSGFYDDKQHGTTMDVPFGKVNLSEDGYSASLLYEKHITHALSVNWFSAHSYLKRHYADTSQNIYNWRGNVIGQSQFGGESSYAGNLLTLSSRHTLSRLNVCYEWNEHTALKLNYFLRLMDRSGHDPVAAVYYRKDIFANPTALRKHLIASAFEKTYWQDRLSAITTVRYFHYYALGSNLSAEATSITNRTTAVGYGQAFRYKFNPSGQFKVSYERSVRLPDEAELFGLGNITLPNPSLLPERSHSLNAGLSWHDKTKRLTIESGVFYRLVDDIIYQRLITPVSSQFQNLLKVQVAGIEASTQYTLLPAVRLHAQATYQDLRNKKVSGDLTQRYVGARLPNIPFLFGGTGVTYQKAALFKKTDKLEAWWGLQYVHWFYLYWSIDGRKDTKEIIPDQWIQQAGASYHLKEDQWVITFEANNLFDQRAYDNYHVQRPGRSCALKIRFYLTN